MQTKRFRVNNQPFVCQHCGCQVSAHPSSSRDHCTNCLYSLHVDINPGDRRNTCLGILEPIGLKITGSKQQIVYRCQKCDQLVFNIVASDDDLDAIFQLAALTW